MMIIFNNFLGNFLEIRNEVKTNSKNSRNIPVDLFDEKNISTEEKFLKIVIVFKL